MTDPAVASSPAVEVRVVVPADLPRMDALMSALDGQARYRRWFTGAADVHRAAALAAHPEEQGARGARGDGAGR